jgi:hypothetical protein
VVVIENLTGGKTLSGSTAMHQDNSMLESVLRATVLIPVQASRTAMARDCLLALASTFSVSFLCQGTSKADFLTDGPTIAGHSSGSNNQGNSNGANSHVLIGKLVRASSPSVLP